MDTPKDQSRAPVVDTLPGLSGLGEYPGYEVVAKEAISAAYQRLKANNAKSEEIAAVLSRMAAMMGVPQATVDAILKAAPKAYETLMDEQTKLQTAIPAKMIDLYIEAAKHSMALEKDNTDGIIKAYLQNQQMAVQHWFKTATGPQDIQLAILGLAQGIATIMKFIPGYAEKGAMLEAMIRPAQEELMKYSLARKKDMESMSFTMTDDQVKQYIHNNALSGVVKAGVSPLNNFYQDLEKYFGPDKAQQLMRHILTTAHLTPDDFKFRSGAGVGVLSSASHDAVFNALIQQESNGNPAAVSNKGARGLGQMMPETAEATAKEMGLKWDPKKYDSDPAYQLQLARGHFDGLVRKYDGNMVLVLAAYNSGEGAVADFMNGTNLSKNTRGEPTNPRGIKLGDPRQGTVTNDAFAAGYPYDETRNYILSIASRVAGGGPAQVAKAEPKKPEAPATQPKPPEAAPAAAAAGGGPSAARPSVPAAVPDQRPVRGGASPWVSPAERAKKKEMGGHAAVLSDQANPHFALIDIPGGTSDRTVKRVVGLDLVGTDPGNKQNPNVPQARTGIDLRSLVEQGPTRQG